MFCRGFLSDARIESNQSTSAKTVIFLDKSGIITVWAVDIESNYQLDRQKKGQKQGKIFL